jgi:hypothetical protein
MNSSSRQFLWPVFVLVGLTVFSSLAATTTAFRVLESPTSTSNSANYYLPNNQKNQQTAFITSLLPPLPVSTTASAPWGTTPTTTSPTTNGRQRLLDNNNKPNCNIAGVNLSKAVVERKNHLSHPLWYDDHNPTARKVKYFDCYYENGYVSITYYCMGEHYATAMNDAYTHSQCWSNTIDSFFPLATGRRLFLSLPLPIIGPKTPPRLSTRRDSDVVQWSIYGVGPSNGTVVGRPAPS